MSKKQNLFCYKVAAVNLSIAMINAEIGDLYPRH